MKSKLVQALMALLLVTACAGGAEKTSPASATIKRIGLLEFDTLRATNTNMVILDVRSAAEFAKGRIAGATNIDISSFRFEEKVGALDKSKTYVVSCAVGMRSARASKKMEAMGFKELYDLAPGFDGWKKAGRPFEK